MLQQYGGKPSLSCGIARLKHKETLLLQASLVYLWQMRGRSRGDEDLPGLHISMPGQQLCWCVAARRGSRLSPVVQKLGSFNSRNVCLRLETRWLSSDRSQPSTTHSFRRGSLTTIILRLAGHTRLGRRRFHPATCAGPCGSRTTGARLVRGARPLNAGNETGNRRYRFCEV